MTARSHATKFERVAIDVDTAGHLAVTIDGERWKPLTNMPDGHGIRLGRSDVPWVLDRLMDERDLPMQVVLNDSGRRYTDLLIPQNSRTEDLRSTTPSGYGPHRHPVPLTRPSVEEVPSTNSERPGPGIDGGGFDPEETVVIALVVARAAADQNGEVVFRVPEALRSKAGLLLMYGQDSGVTLHFGPELDRQESDGTTATVSVARDVHRHADFGRDFEPGTP